MGNFKMETETEDILGSYYTTNEDGKTKGVFPFLQVTFTSHIHSNFSITHGWKLRIIEFTKALGQTYIPMNWVRQIENFYVL